MIFFHPNLFFLLIVEPRISDSSTGQRLLETREKKVEVVINKGLTFVKIFYFKIPISKAQPRVANIPLGKNSFVRPKMLSI